jgi:SNF2 family DNA or RNA helicase
MRDQGLGHQPAAALIQALVGGEVAPASTTNSLTAPQVEAIPLLTVPEARAVTALARPLEPRVRQARLLDETPWVRALGKLSMEVSTEGWRFPVGSVIGNRQPAAGNRQAEPTPGTLPIPDTHHSPVTTHRSPVRLRPPPDVVMLKERLLYLLQPPLDTVFAGRQVQLPFQPYPYQLEGIAFLMPRWSALLADEMGLGKTIQTIVALRLLFHAGLIHRALIVCPKPLVHNWTRELRLWAEDVPFEVIGGDADARRCSWLISNCPLKLINYELLTRDAAYLEDPQVQFDLVVLDEAQRIKNRTAKTAQAVRSIKRQRSWALTGTPIENRPEDLINLFAFVKPDHIPPDTPAKRLPELTADCILRRVTEDVLTDLPPKIVRDAFVELTPAQRAAYQLAETEGVIRLNNLGDTITVQHVFELVMRLKQICNFDPCTGESAKLEQLLADLHEIAASGRKAIIFSQWVEPLELLARRLAEFGPLQFHGRIPPKERQEVLDTFRTDPRKRILLMSYGTGSVGLNLQFANYVFLFDRWWNPAVEDQAIKRAHRIGQKEPVFVMRFVAQNTIEGRICEVLEKKRQLFSDLIEANGTPAALGLSEEEIFGLFDLQVRPRRLAA